MMYKELEHKTLLLVEDEKVTAQALARLLKKYFKQIFVAYDGQEGYDAYQIHRPDIILTDIQMPVLTGLQMIEKIRKTDREVVITILTAYNDATFMQSGAKMRLDEYMIKPLDPQSVQNFLQKLNGIFSGGEKCVTIDGASRYVYESKELIHKQQTIRLTYSEIELLELLLKHANKAVKYEQIESTLYKEAPPSDNAIKVLVSRLRRKAPFLHIENISNIGYKLAF